MGDSNKILDVTYGGFSCRLEGFDDSVETMKTVVSYFHDLAGHDRFMDMDPQAPDMDTLTRLTEEQAGGEVDVDGDGQNVSLRLRKPEQADTQERPSLRNTPTRFIDNTPAGDDLLDDLAAFEEELDTVDEVEGNVNAFADDAMEDDLAEDVSEAEAEAEAVDEIDPVDFEESVADKLQRIRAVVGRGKEPEGDDAYAEDLNDADNALGAVSPLAQRLAELAQNNTELTDLDAENEADMSAADDAEDDIADALEEVADDVAEELENNDGVASDDSDVEDTVEDTVEEFAKLDAEAAAPGPLVLTSRVTASDSGDHVDKFGLRDEVAEIDARIASRPANQISRDTMRDNVDDSMNRILSQTDQHLNQPEVRRQRDAFAQLKAAVAATEAARQLGDPGAQLNDGEDAFKDDLGAHDAEEIAEAPATTPLKLVSAELEEETPVEEVQQEAKPLDAASERLRQIAALKEPDATPTASGFAEFATAQGAEDLVDLMEAAAAYISFVEGGDDFSRPQVMKKVQSVVEEEISREDGLRSFGRLLRQSKIIKLNNGRFQVSANSRFRPDDDKTAQG